MKRRRRPSRLPRESYVGQLAVAFTVTLEDPTLFFTSRKIVEKCTEILAKSTTKYDCDAIYCFMPEHVHLIFIGHSHKSDLLAGIESFKQGTGHWLKSNTSGVRWQESFYDHIIRVHADLRAQVWYLVNNPVRPGLVDEWTDYPFTGAIGINLKEFLSDVSSF